ncbi:MAG: PAS domain-containing protein, partial [Myxococcota bacterium]
MINTGAKLSSDALETLLDRLPIGAIVLDDQAIIQRFNRYEEQLSGRKRKDVIGKSFFSDVAPCTEDILLGKRFREGIEQNNLDLDIEFNFPYPYNRVARDVRIRAATVRKGPGALHVILIEDITARKALERDNQRMLTSLQRMLQQFDINRGSEIAEAEAIRTPMTLSACVMFADLSSFARTAAQIEPGALFARLDKRVKVAVDAIMRYGGRVDKILGDGVLAFFPATDDGQEVFAAMRAARDACSTFERPEDHQLPFRLGLTRGEIIVGPVGRPEFGMTAMVGQSADGQRLAVEPIAQ